MQRQLVLSHSLNPKRLKTIVIRPWEENNLRSKISLMLIIEAICKPLIDSSWQHLLQHPTCWLACCAAAAAEIHCGTGRTASIV